MPVLGALFTCIFKKLPVFLSFKSLLSNPFYYLYLNGTKLIYCFYYTLSTHFSCFLSNSSETNRNWFFFERGGYLNFRCKLAKFTLMPLHALLTGVINIQTQLSLVISKTIFFFFEFLRIFKKSLQTCQENSVYPKK